jgi:hypothetical protein
MQEDGTSAHALKAATSALGTMATSRSAGRAVPRRDPSPRIRAEIFGTLAIMNDFKRETIEQRRLGWLNTNGTNAQCEYEHY